MKKSNNASMLMRSRSLIREAISETHSKDRTVALDPDTMIFRSQLDGVQGSMVYFMEYFASIILSHGLKPWGRVGKPFFVNTLVQYDQQCDYERGLSCEKCKQIYKLTPTDETVTLFLRCLRNNEGYGEMIVCPDCRPINSSR